MDIPSPFFWLLVYLCTALGVSFLCSLLEASLLAVPLSYVRSLADSGSKRGAQLLDMKQNPDRPLAAILTLNTVAHTFGAAGVGAEAAVLFGHTWVGLVSVIVTVVILLVSEIIPKTLGALHSRRLAIFTTISVRSLVMLTYPLVIVCEAVGRLFTFGHTGGTVTREEVIAMAHLGRSAGVLSSGEVKALSSLLQMQSVSLEQVMTPRQVVFSLPASMSVADALEKIEQMRFTRFPIYDNDADTLVGKVHRYELVRESMRGDANRQLHTIARPILALPTTATVAMSLERMLAAQIHMVQVVDEYGGFKGVVTLEDLLETMLGAEIVDETDPAPDMREFAREMAARRKDEPEA